MHKQDVERQYKHSTSCLLSIYKPYLVLLIRSDEYRGGSGLAIRGFHLTQIHSFSIIIAIEFVPETRVLSHHLRACKSHPTCSEVSHKRSIWRYLERKKSHQKSWIVQVFSHTLTLDLAGAVDGFWTFISNREVLWFVKSRVFWGVCSSSLWVPWGFIEKYPQELLRQHWLWRGHRG